MHACTRREWLVASAVAGMGLAALRLDAAGSLDEGEMILIPGGPFLQGTAPVDATRLAAQYGHHPSWLAGELPQRTVELPPFKIDRFPVTNRRYAAFVEALGYRVPFAWRDGRPRADQLDHPVRYVTRDEAHAFAEWAGKRLPSAAEWEKAARSTDGRPYPWGEEFDPRACQYDGGGIEPPAGTAPVTAHTLGASPFDVMDLIGNIAEYCGDGPAPGTAYIKGGSWLTASPLNLRCAAVGMSGADNNALDYLGFRCAMDA